MFVKIRDSYRCGNDGTPVVTGGNREKPAEMVCILRFYAIGAE